MINVENFISRRNFKNDAKQFYREIGKEKVTVTETPVINDTERFWDTIGSEERYFDEKVERIKEVQTENANITRAAME